MEGTVGFTVSFHHIENLWAESRGHSQIAVAVLDGPVDLSHPCFSGANLTRLDTLVSDPADPRKSSQHGTHVASVIFGQHGGPVHGIAPGCRGLIVPVFEGTEKGGLAPCSQLDLARGITQAVANGAHVINISGGQLDPSGEAHPVLADAVRLCAQNGVLLVAAAGNDACDCLHIPAALPSVLAVGAMDDQGKPLEFSNYGKSYRSHGVLAPGQGIQGAVAGGGTVVRSGTSLAAPVVSGIVALLLSIQIERGQEPDTRTVRRAVLSSAIDCEEHAVSDCRRLLAGRLNIEGALSQLSSGGTMGTTDSEVTHAEAFPSPGAASAGSGMSPEPSPAATLPAAEAANQDQGAGGLASQYAAVTAAAGTDSAVVAEPSQVFPSACGCGAGSAPSLVYALGQIDYDFGTEARRDSFRQHGVENPHDHGALLAHLDENPAHAAAITWILTQEATAIYAIQPAGAFASNAYDILREFLNDQLNAAAERVSIPGLVAGKATLLNGQVVPVIYPELRGMFSWSTAALVEAVLGRRPSEVKRNKYDRMTAEIADLLERVYYELRNLGLAPQERAINHAATNAFQLGYVYGSAIEAEMRLDGIAVERSPICRPDSDCWDVKLTFFDPSKRLERAREVYRFTVDVSDVVPVSVGEVRHWPTY